MLSSRPLDRMVGRKFRKQGAKTVNRPLDREVLSKVPEVTLIFWIVKVAATTLGETGGDSVTMTLNWDILPAHCYSSAS